jgi:hypothetical protein
MSTDAVAVTEGTGKNVATYNLTEDAKTKQLQRVSINNSDGTSTDLATSAKQDTTNTNLVALGTKLDTLHADAGTTLHADLTAVNTSVGTLNTNTGAKADATWDGAAAASGISIFRYIGVKLEAVRALLAGTLTVGTHAVTGSGSFASTVADGANVTLGAKADTAWDGAAASPTSQGIFKFIGTKLEAIRALLAGTLTVATHAVTGSGSFASTVADGANTTLGAKTDAKSVATDATSVSAMSVFKQISASIQAAATSLAGTLTVATHAVTQSGTWAVTQSGSWALSAGAALIGKVGIDQTTPGTTNKVSIGTDGTVALNAALPAGTNVIGGVKQRAFAVAGSVVTRPANVTPYTALDAVSNNATAASVTATSFALSDTNDDTIALERMRLATADTGVSGKAFRVYLYQADPTASTGVVGGDNAAFSTKQGAFIGSMSGSFRTFSDGCVAVLTPDEGSRIITAPTSGAKTVFGLLQTLNDFTPSGNSTVFTPTLEGTQHRA